MDAGRTWRRPPKLALREEHHRQRRAVDCAKRIDRRRPGGLGRRSLGCERHAGDSCARSAENACERRMGQATPARTRGAGSRGYGRSFRCCCDSRLRNRRCGSLSLKRRRRRDLQRAASGGGQPGRRCAAGGIGRDAQRAHAVERRAPFPDRKPDERTGHRLIVAIAHLDDRRDRRFLLNDVDPAFAFDHDNLQRGGLSSLRRRIREPRPQRRLLAGLDGTSRLFSR